MGTIDNKNGIEYIWKRKVEKMAGKKQKKTDFSKYEDKWIVLSTKTGKILSADDSLQKLLKQYKNADFKSIEFMRIPRFDVCYAP